MEESDDIHAALALMYGYAAKYAPSTVIEARIDALVVSNMLLAVLYFHPLSEYEFSFRFYLLQSVILVIIV